MTDCVSYTELTSRGQHSAVMLSHCAPINQSLVSHLIDIIILTLRFYITDTYNRRKFNCMALYSFF